MELEIQKDSIKIMPENEQDRAYLIHILGLHKENEEALAKRVDIGKGFCPTSEISHVVIGKKS